MLTALVIAAALGLSDTGNDDTLRSNLYAGDMTHGRAVVLARGGRERIDPFAEIKEKRRQEAKEKRDQKQHTPNEASQDRAN